jgi:hypothetical protein
MSISWEIQITNVNITTQRGDVTATRTDSESALPPQVYQFNNTPIGTGPDRVLLLNTIKSEVEKKALHDASIEAVITDLEQTGKSQLEAWEATR